MISILATANEWHDQHKSDKITYLQNHINAVQAMKRICRQLRKVEEKTDNKQSLKGNENTHTYVIKLYCVKC